MSSAQAGNSFSNLRAGIQEKLEESVVRSSNKHFIPIQSQKSFHDKNGRSLQDYRAQMEQRLLNNLKASIVGGPQTTENKLALSTLRAVQEEKKLLSHISNLPLEIKYIILGLSSPNNECVDKRHRQLTVRHRRTFKALTNLPLQTQLKNYLQANGQGLLENFDLSKSRLTNQDLAWIALHFPHLTQLNLRWTRVTDAGLAHVAGLNRLTKLNLGHTQVTDAGLAHVAGLNRLTQLNLGGTRVTDVGLQNVAGLNNLTQLNLGWAQVTDAGLAHVAGLNRLTELNLGNTRVTDAGLLHVAGLNNLTELNLTGTRVTDAGRLQLPLRLR